MADIFGSTSDDYLEGTEGDDLIVAGTGADTVHGYGGNDVIRFTAEQHGSSADSFLGGTGVDTLEFDFLYNGSFASLELAVGTTIEGWISIDNAKSANVSEIEKITSTFNTFRDHVTLTLGASVSPDIHFAIDGNGVDYFYEDSLVILAQALGTGLTITSSNGVIQSSLGTFTSFEVLTVEGTEFADTFSAAGVLGGGTSLNGHGGNDTLDGSGAADYLFGEAGNDLVHGGGGNDFLGGGAGVDLLYGGEGNDTFLVDSLDDGDVFDGGEGADFLYFSLRDATHGVSIDLSPIWSGGTVAGSSATFTSIEGIQPFEGTQFDDTIILGANAPSNGGSYYLLTMNGGNDYVSGSDNSEGINGNAGNDWLLGLGGNDTLYGDDGADQLDGGAGDDWVFGGTGNDSVVGGIGDDRLVGDGGDDSLVGGAGSDHLRGDAGIDTLAGGDGTDFVFVDGQDSADGGAGFDYLVVDMRAETEGRTIDLADTSRINGFEGVMLVLGSDYDDYISIGGLQYTDPEQVSGYYWAISNFKGIRGGGGNDYMVGADSSLSSDELNGDDGNDTLVTFAGNDVLYGGPGDDNLYGGADSDTYHVESLADLVFENPGEGTDTVYAGSSYYLYANVENLVLEGWGNAVFGVGNDLANTITGNGADNLLIGGGGDDVLDGGNDGNDLLFGQDGNDSLAGGTGVDYLVGGAGNDLLDGSYHPDALYGEDGDDVLQAGPGFDTDILVGGAGKDVLYGNSGQGDYDLMDGGAGNDAYYVDTGDDLTFEAADGGIDTVYANVPGFNNGVYLYPNVENLVLVEQTAFGVGNELANHLTGSASDNWLLGGAGDDVLDGQGGLDILFGEAGNDTFVFQPGSFVDGIGDFHHGEDKIDVSAYHFASFAALQNGFHQVGGDGAIDLGGGDNIVVLLGVTMSTLTAGDFTL